MENFGDLSTGYPDSTFFHFYPLDKYTLTHFSSSIRVWPLYQSEPTGGVSQHGSNVLSKNKKYFTNTSDYHQLPTKVHFLSSDFFSIRNRYNMVYAIEANSDSGAACRLCGFREISLSEPEDHLKSENSIIVVYSSITLKIVRVKGTKVLLP